MTHEQRLLYLRGYVDGLLKLLDECCTQTTSGRHVHRINQPKTVLKLWRGALGREPSPETLDRISERLPDMAIRVQQLHREWRELQRREGA